ncbi:MAG TPA: hypothetical protein VFT22_11005 [Kofleriaceae bacterium]|nr:hypothetical protein [Kofleriaceae bacterium]
MIELTGPRPRWIDGGTCGADAIEMIIRNERPDLIVIEKPVALHCPEANVHVLATTFLAGELAERARHTGVNTMTVTNPQWRMALIGRAIRESNQDREVKFALKRIVDGLPKRTNCHARDAAGAALIGARIWAREHPLRRPIGPMVGARRNW